MISFGSKKKARIEQRMHLVWDGRVCARKQIDSKAEDKVGIFLTLEKACKCRKRIKSHLLQCIPQQLPYL